MLRLSVSLKKFLKTKVMERNRKKVGGREKRDRVDRIGKKLREREREEVKETN